jgi:hypothetical protein
MSRDIKIKFDPASYLGWELNHFHSRDKPYGARKETDFLSADSLSELLSKIDTAEAELLLFDPPIKAMWKNHSPVQWIPVEFYAMRSGRVFYRDERGQAMSEFVRNFESGHTSDKFRLINDEYAELAKRVEAAVRANQKAFEKASMLKRGFAKLSPEIFESASVKPGREEP